ncbi:TPA: hypothetical protein ACXI1H_000331 [Stenotrophomonas maltophilia]
MFDREPCPCPNCHGTPVDARQLVKRLASQAENAADLPPYERVVGVQHANQALAAALTMRAAGGRPSEPLTSREVMMVAVIDALKRHRALVNAPHSVYATELMAASHQIDAALAALAAHDFDAGPGVRA